MTWGEIIFTIYLAGVLFVGGVMVGVFAHSYYEKTPWKEIGQSVTVTILWPLVVPGSILLAWMGL